MKSIALIILVLSFSLLQAEDVKIQVSRDFVKDKPYWLVRGSLIVPGGTILTLRVLFQQQEVPGSFKRIFSEPGKFTYYCPLQNSRPLDGQYVLELKANLGANTTTVNTPFVWGTLSSGRRQRRDYVNFLINKSKELESLLLRIEQGQKDYSALVELDDQKREEVRSWVKSLRESLINIRQEYDKRAHPAVLVSYCGESMRDFSVILPMAQELLRFSTEQVLFQTKIATNKPRPLANTDQYKQEIGNRIKKVLGREDIASTTKMDDFQADLIWFNDIYRVLAQNYQEAQQNFQENTWVETVKYVDRELEDFEMRLGDYRQAVFVNTDPQVLPTLEKMVRLVRSLKDLYGAVLRKLPGAKDPQNVREELEQAFNLVYERAQTYIQNQKQKRTEVLVSAHGILLQMEQLEQEFSQKMDSYRNDFEKPEGKLERDKAFTEWLQGWQQKRVEFKGLSLNLQTPENCVLCDFLPSFNYLIVCMENVDVFYLNFLQKQGDAIKNLEYAKYYHNTLRSQIMTLKEKTMGK